MEFYISLFFFIYTLFMLTTYVTYKKLQQRISFTARSKIGMVVIVLVLILLGYTAGKSYLDSRSQTVSEYYNIQRCILNRDFDTAEESLDRLLPGQPNNTLLNLSQARILMFKKQYYFAEQRYAKALQTANQSSEQIRRQIQQEMENARNAQLLENAPYGTSGGGSGTPVIQQDIPVVERYHQTVRDNIGVSLSNLENSNHRMVQISEALAQTKDIIKNNRVVEAGTQIEILKDLYIQESNPNIARAVAELSLLVENYDQAKHWCVEAIKKGRTTEDYILLSEIYMRSTGNASEPSISLEMQRINKRIENLNNRVSQLEQEHNISRDLSTRERIASELTTLRKNRIKLQESLNFIMLNRLVNLLEAQRGKIFAEKNPFLTLQIAKLYNAMDENDKAKKYIREAMNEIERFKITGTRKEALNEIKSVYQDPASRNHPYRVDSALNDLSNKAYEFFPGNSTDFQNNKWREFLRYYIENHHIDVYINGIDKVNYPEIKATVRVGSNKEWFIFKNLSFGKRDFGVTDTDIDIKNFNIVRNNVYASNIVLVMDKSGSMEGMPLYNSIEAGKILIDKLGRDEKLAILAFSDQAEVLSSFTDSKRGLKYAIDRLTPYGGTNIYGSLQQAISMLEAKGGSRAIILLTDGCHNSGMVTSEQVIEQARFKGINIFSVGMGEAQRGELERLSEETGGRAYMIPSSTELDEIFNTIRLALKNQYMITYKADKNQDIPERYLKVTLQNKSEDRLDYRLYEDTEDDNENKPIIIDPEDLETTFMLDGILGGTVVKSDKGEERIKLLGNGFKHGKFTIHVGTHKINNKDIKVIDNKMLELKIPKVLGVGAYDIKGVGEDGRVWTLQNVLNIVKAGKQARYDIGKHYITANSISKIGPDQYKAVGNIQLDGILRFKGSLLIKKGNENSATIENSDIGYVSLGDNADNGNSFVRNVLKGRTFNLLQSNSSIFIDAFNDINHLNDRDNMVNLFLMETHTGKIIISPEKINYEVIRLRLQAKDIKKLFKDQLDIINANVEVNPIVIITPGKLDFKGKFKVGTGARKDFLTKHFRLSSGELEIDTVNDSLNITMGVEAFSVVVELAVYTKHFGYDGFKLEVALRKMNKEGKWEEKSIDVVKNVPGLLGIKTMGVGADDCYGKPFQEWFIGANCDMNVFKPKIPMLEKYLDFPAIITLDDMKFRVRLANFTLKFTTNVKFLTYKFANGELLIGQYEYSNAKLNVNQDVVNGIHGALNVQADLKLPVKVERLLFNGSAAMDINRHGLAVNGTLDTVIDVEKNNMFGKSIETYSFRSVTDIIANMELLLFNLEYNKSYGKPKGYIKFAVAKNDSDVIIVNMIPKIEVKVDL